MTTFYDKASMEWLNAVRKKTLDITSYGIAFILLNEYLYGDRDEYGRLTGGKMKLCQEGKISSKTLIKKLDILESCGLICIHKKGFTTPTLIELVPLIGFITPGDSVNTSVYDW